MSGNILYEGRLVCSGFLTGIGLLMVYDCVRVFRILFSHRSIWMGVEDMLYWIYSSLIVFTLLYRENDGNLRAYVIAAVFAGMVLYQWLISRKMLNYLKKLVESVKVKKRHRPKKKLVKHEIDKKS